MAESVNLVLYPEVKSGEDVTEVKERLTKTLSVDQATVDSWYATENPTAILKDVDKPTARKYADAITKCGAQCNLQPAGSSRSNWSLEKMTKGQTLFVCPSCEHEEEIEQGTRVEQCPNCGLVMAKWEEKMREAAEKEKIRRRLLREQRLKGDRETDLDAKRRELERLRELEREIMKELGIKPPSRLWLLFEKYTFPMAFGAAVVLIAITAVGFRFLDLYLENLAYRETVAAPPTEEMQHIAPVVAAAVELQQHGNQQVITEIADAAQVIRGQGTQPRQEMTKAAMQIMKGVEQDKFIQQASKAAPLKTRTMTSDAEPEAMPVNIDTVGGISGLQGVSLFSMDQLDSMSPPLLEHGHERILSVLTEKIVIEDALNPESEIVVDAIDEMDGSAIVMLMSSIGRDQEWDQFLLSHVNRYLQNGDTQSAERLTERIRNVVVRIDAYSRIMEEQVISGDANAVRALASRVRFDLDRIAVPDTKARTVINMGRRLTEAGSETEPTQTLDTINAMIVAAKGPFEQASLLARLAQAHMMTGDQVRAKQALQRAMQTAGRIGDVRQRVSAFAQIAQRYYDIRNNTLASEILSEASVLAATELVRQPRSVAFGELAIARAYVGDFAGARQAAANASEGRARQQLIAKIAEMLIGEERFYEAVAWMERLDNATEYGRLELRLSSALYYSGETRQAVNRLEQSAPRVRRIYELTERGLLMSQYARLLARFGREDLAEQLFTEAQQISSQLKGRKSEVILAIVALDRARVFQLGRARELIVNELQDNVVKDPIDAEIVETERIARSLLPESAWSGG